MKNAHPQTEETRDEFLTARQLASFLQVSESTVRRLAREGRIPCVRLTPRLIRFNLKAVCKSLDGTSHKRNAGRDAETQEHADAQLTFAEML